MHVKYNKQIKTIAIIKIIFCEIIVMPSWKQTDSKVIWENVILIEKNYIGAAGEYHKRNI